MTSLTIATSVNQTPQPVLHTDAIDRKQFLIETHCNLQVAAAN